MNSRMNQGEGKKIAIWLWRQNWVCGSLCPNLHDPISFWSAAFLILSGKTKKCPLIYISHEQVSWQKETKSMRVSTPRNSYEAREKRAVPVYSPWFFKWRLLLQLTSKMRPPQWDGTHIIAKVRASGPDSDAHSIMPGKKWYCLFPHTFP